MKKNLLLLFAVCLVCFAAKATTFYSIGNTAANTPGNWNTDSSGLGTPAIAGDFTTPGNTFWVRTDMTMSANWTIANNNNILIQPNGSLSPGSFTITLGGDWTNNGTFTAGTSTVAFNATSTGHTLNGSMTGSNKFNNLTFNSITGAWSFGANAADVGGNLTITNTAGGGVTAPSTTLKIAGNFTKTAGTFVHNSGTIEMNGTVGQTLPATAITFHNLQISNVTTTVAAAVAITVNNTLTTDVGAILNMATFQLLGGFTAANSGTIRTQNVTNPPIPTGKTWGGTVLYNSTTTAMFVSAGNYNNLTITGTTGSRTFTGAVNVAGNFSISSTTGITTLGGALDVNGNVTLSVTDVNINSIFNPNGNTINVGGNWTVNSSTTGATILDATSPSTVIFDGTGPQTISKATGANLVANFYNLQNSNTTSTLTVVISPSVTTTSIANDFTNDASATFVCAGANTINVAGNWTNNGTFTAGTGTVAFFAPDAGNTLNGSMTGSNKFNNLTFNNGSGAWSFGANAADIGAAFTITSGTVTAPSTTLKVAGAFAKGPTATFTHNSGTVELNGTGAQAIPTNATTFNNVNISNTGGAVSANAAITIDGTLTTTATTTLNMTTAQMLGAVTPAHSGLLQTQCTVNPAIPTGKTWGGTVLYNSTTTAMFVADGNYNNLTISGTTGNRTFTGATTVASNFSISSTTGVTALGGALDVNGNITIAETGNTNSIFNPNGNTINIAGNWNVSSTGTSTSLLNASGVSTVIFDGTSPQTISKTSGASLVANFYNLQNSNTTSTLTVVTSPSVTATTMANDFTNDASATFVCAGANTITVAGNWTNNGTFTAATSTVNMTSAAAGKTLTGNMTGSNAFRNLTFSNGTGAWSFGANAADVTNTFTLTNGTVTAPSTTLKVAGAFVKSAGTFTHNSGTVELNGSGAQAIPTTATTFNNVNVSNTGGVVSANAAITIDGTLTTAPTTTVNMATFQMLGTVTPAHTGLLQTQCTANPAIPTGKTWGGLVQYNSTTTAMFVAHGTYNNLTITGTTGARTFTGATTVNGNLNVGSVATTTGITTLGGDLTVAGNLTIGSSTTLGIFDVSASNYQITLAGNWIQSSSAATNPFNKRAGLVRINGAGIQTFTTSGGTSIPTFHHFQNSNTAATLTLGAAFTLSGNFTNDLGATTDCGANTVAITGNCTNDGTMTASTNPFTVTGNWSNSGTFTAGANTLNIGGDWTNTGTFNASTGTVNFNATATGKTLNGDMTGGNKFNNLIFNSATGAWSFGANAADVGGNFTITTTTGVGGVTAPSTTLKVAGNFVHTAGTFTHNSGTVELNGTGAQTVPGATATTFHTLAPNNATGTITLNGATTVNADFTIPASNTLACGAQTLTLGGNYTNNGTFTANTGTVAFTAGDAGNTLNGDMTGSNAFRILTFNNAAGAWSFGANAADVTNTFTITNGTVTAPSTTLKVAGAFVKSAGTFTHNSGTVELNGTGAQAIPTTATTFNNVNVSNTGGVVSANAAITIDGTLTTSPTTTVNMATFQMLGAVTAAAHSGLLQSQCTLNPAIPTGRTWGGLVQYNSTTTAMFVAHGTYNNLTITGTTGARTFTGATTVNGNMNVGSAATTTGITTLGGDLTVVGNLTIGSSTTLGIFDVSASNYQITLGGNWIQSSSAATNPFNKRAGLVRINGTGIQTFTTSGGTSIPTFHHFQNSNTAATLTLGAAFTLSGNFTNDLGATTDCGANTVAITGNCTNDGTMTASTNPFTVTGNWSNSGTFTVGANTLNIGGDWTNTGTFNASTGTVNFNATATGKTLNGDMTGGNKFNNLTFNSATGAWSFGANAADVGGNFTITTTTGVGGVTAPSTTLKVAGNFVHTAGTFTHNSGTVEMNGTGAQTVPGATATTFHTLAPNNAAGTITLNGATTVNADFTIPASNTLACGAQTLTLGGNYTNNGTFTANTGTVAFTAGDAGNTLNGGMTGSNAFRNLTFNNAAGAWSFGANAADVTNTFTITNGTVTAPSTTLKVAGAFVKSAGTFTHNSGTVELNGTGAQAIPTTATTFNNLNVTNTAGVVAANAAITISGALTTTPTTTVNMVTFQMFGPLNATAHSGLLQTQCTVNPPVPTATTWGGTVLYNSTTTAMSVSAGNYNDLTITGTTGARTFTGAANVSGNFSVSTTTGVTTLAGALDVNGNVSLAVTSGNNADIFNPGSNTINVGGNWSVSTAGTATTLMTPASTSTVVFDGTGAQTISKTSGANLVANFYNLRNSNTTSTLTVVTSPSVTTTTVGNNFTNDASATFVCAGANTINVAGNWANNGAFTAATSTVNLNAGGVGRTLTGNMTGTSKFNNLTFNGASGAWSFGANAADVGGNLTFTATAAGGVTAPSTTLKVAGNIVHTAGTFTHNSGTVEMNGTGAQTLPGAVSLVFNTLALNNTGGTITTNGAITVNAAFTIPAGNVLSIGATHTLTLGSSYTNNGTFTAGGGTTTFTSAIGGNTLNGDMTGSNKFNNLTFNNATGGWSFGANAADVAGNFTITNGAVTAPSTTLKIAGNFAKAAGTFTHNSGIVELNGTGAQTLPGGTATTFNTLTPNNTGGTITLNNATTVNNDFTIPASNTLACGAQTLSLGGNYTNSGTFTANTGTVTFIAGDAGNTLSGSMTGTNKFNNLTFNNAAGAWSFGANPADVGAGFTVTNGTVTAPSTTLKVGGVFARGATGTFTHNNGTVEMNGAAIQSLPTNATTFYDLNISNTAGTVSGTAAITVDGTLTTSVATTVNMVTNQLLGSFTAAHSGTLQTQNVANPPIPNGKTWGGLVQYNSTTTVMSVASGNYNNLSISGTTGPRTFTGAVSVGGNMTVSSTTGVSTLGGALTVAGNLTITSTTTPNILDVTASNHQISLGGNWTQSSTAATNPFNKRTGTVVINGTGAQLITTSGGTSRPTFNNLTINNTTTAVALTQNIDVTATMNVMTNATVNPLAAVQINTAAPAGVLTGNGTILVTRTAATADLANQYKFSTYTMSGLTANYNAAAAQSVNSHTYGTLITSGSGTKTAAGNLTVNDGLNVEAPTTLDMGTANRLIDATATYTVSGTLKTSVPTATSSSPIPSGVTWNGSGTVEYGALTGAQTVVSGVYNNLSLSNTSGINDASGTITTNGILTLGKINIAANNLILGNSATISGASSSNYIVATGAGRVRKGYAANGSFAFPIGDATNYTPVTLNVSGSGYSSAYAEAKVTDAVHPNNANTNHYLTRYWSINTSGITGQSYDATCTYIGADVTGTEGLISGASYAGSLPWIKYGAAGSNTLTATAISTSNTDISGITTAVPVVSVLPATSSTCTGSSINLDASGTTGDPTLTYSWAPSTGLSATTGATVTASPTTTGTVTSVYVYTVTVTDGNGFTATATATVSITPAPVAITGTLQVCEGATVTLGHPDAGGTWTSVTPAVATIDISTGEVTGVSSGNTTISYVPSVGCLATAVVTVNNQPSAISGTLTVCEFATTALGNTEPGGVWTSSAPSTASIGTSSGIVTGVNDGNATISYTLSGDCRVTAIVTVNPVPDTGTISGANNVNRGATTLLTEDIPGGVWSTSNGNASISIGGLVTGVSGGNVVISYGVTNGCGTLYATKSFRVNAITDAIYGPAVMCVGLESTFTHPFTGGTWSSSDTAILTVDETTGEATAVTSGVATISYFADMSFQTKSVTVNTPIPAITGSPSVCLGTTLALSHASEGGIWSTTMGHVATVNSSTGVVTPVTSGVVFITYTLGTGCHTVRLFTINPLPGVISGSMIVCQGNTTTLSSSTFSGAWTSGTPAVATINVSSGVVTGVSPGTAAITYTALTGCVRNAVVTVNAPLGSITGDPQVCVGNTNATLVAPAPGGTWSSSNTSVVTAHATTGLLTGIGAGTATISYIAGPGCVTSIVATVSSVAVITGSDNMCAGSGITLSNATPGGVWSSSNTTVATVVAGTGVVTGVAGGTAHISYALTTGCYKTKLVTVNSLPNNINGTAILCSGNTTALTNATSGGTWSSSTPAIATIGTSGIVSGVSAGTSTISYTLSTGCRATRIVTVNTTPAVITGTGILCAGNTTSLSSATPGGVWSSANTSIATINSGTGLVTGVSGGTSTISYTIGACFRISVVTVTPLPATITGLLALCVGNTSTLLSATTGGTWVSSDVSKATIHSTTGVATGIGAGTSNITYTKTGCITTAVVTVSTVAAITGTAVLCPGNTTTLAHVTAGGTWSSANTARATVGSASGIVTGLSSGTVRISYILTGACAQSIVVTVNPLPNSISGTSIICVGSTTTFSSTTGGGVWSSSTPATATVSVAGLVTGVGAGTSTITYQLATGCFATRVVTVSVAPGAITGTASVCIGSTTALGATPGGGVWSSSNITKATIDAGTGIATGVAAGTTFITYALGSCRSTRVLTVLATPGAISGALLTCAGSTTQLASPTFAGAWSSTDVTKATIHPTTGMVSGVAIGTSTISYVVSGCARTAVVTVNAAVGAITGTPLVCVGQTIATLVGPGGGTWSSSNASIANVHSITAILTGVGAGNATITYRVSAGCYSTIVSTVNAAIPSITGTLSVCEGGVGSTTTLANATPGGTWASSNTLKATVNSGTGEVTGVGGGSTTISYILSTGCYKTTTFTVNFVPTPFDATGFIIEDAPPDDTVMISSIAGGIWESGHPLIATIVPDVPGKAIVTGVSPGFATISYTFPTGCMRTGVIEVVAARPGNPGPGKGQTGVNSIYSLYPNPTSGIININSPVRGMLVVYTIDGKQVAQYRLTSATTTVTLPKKLAAGMYMCKFTGDDNSTDIIRLQYQP
jgi:trimeric autotransporter adhesin